MLSPLPTSTPVVDWMALTMGLFGGLALFLLGLDLMAKSLQAAAGESVKFVLAKLTRNRLLGALTGAFVTAVLNSSSVTTVLVVGFITAGLMTLSQSIGVIMGANVGSTFTAQVIAFDVTRWSLAMIAVGFVLSYTARRDRTREAGSMILGLGLLFFGMGVMGESMVPLRDYPPFLELMARMENPALGILVGALFTGLVQSSAATTGIAIVMASGGLVTLSAGIALALGANIGTCVTALLAAIGKPRDAQRAATAHILFNVLGVALWVGLIDVLAEFAARISPSYADLSGGERMAREVPRQIANAHTVFNVANTLLFLPFTGLLARLVVRLLPDRPDLRPGIVRPRFLDPELVDKPSLALDRVRLEIGHLGEIVEQMLERIGPSLLTGRRAALDELARMDDQVDLLHERILDYLGRIRRHPMTDHESHDFLTWMSVADYLESIGDVIQTNLVDVGHKLIDQGVRPSETMEHLLDRLNQDLRGALAAAVRAVREDSEQAALDVLSYKDDLNRLIDEVLRHQAARLSAAEPRRPAIFRIEMSFVDAQKRIYTLTKRIAKVMLPEELRRGLAK